MLVRATGPAAAEVPRQADVFPGDATGGAAQIGAAPAAQREATDHGWRVLGILSLLMGFASISTDLYLPAMPAMGRSLGADTGMVELTISGYLVGFSLGQLVWAPVCDRYGRRLPVALGPVLFVAGSAGCALAGSGWAMIGFRVVQALGACASVVLARAMVRDLYEGARAAQMMSTLITVMAITPLNGPILGGQILAFAGWRAIFWTLAAVGVLTLLVLLTLPETLPPAQRNQERLATAFMRYGELLRHRSVLGYAGAGGFFYGATFAYTAGTPFAYISYYHVPEQLYGLLFGAGIAGIMATNTLNARLVRRVGSDRLLRYGATGAALFGLVLAMAARTGWGGLWGLVDAVVLVRVGHRLHRRQLDRRGPGRLSHPGRGGLGPGGRHAVRQCDLRSGFAVPFRPSLRAALDAALHPAWLLRRARHGLRHFARTTSVGGRRLRPGRQPRRCGPDAIPQTGNNRGAFLARTGPLA